MDEVMRELEVRKAPLPVLLLSDEQLRSFFPGESGVCGKG